MKRVWEFVIAPVRHIVPTVREIVTIGGALRREKPLWAVVESAGPDRGWNIRAVHHDARIAHLVSMALNDADGHTTVRRHDLVLRDNREIAARVYRQEP